MILDFAYEGWCYLYSNDIFDTFKMHWYIMTCILLISEPTSINKCLYNFSKNTHCASALIISNKNFQKFVIYEIHPLWQNNFEPFLFLHTWDIAITYVPLLSLPLYILYNVRMFDFCIYNYLHFTFMSFFFFTCREKNKNCSIKYSDKKGNGPVKTLRENLKDRITDIKAFDQSLQPKTGMYT